MLNQRQVEILLEMMENAGTYMTASHFTGRHGVSLRTVQGDMKAIRSELDSFSCLEYDSTAPKGSRVRILDEEEAREVRNSLLRQYSDNPNGGQEERVRQILLLLLRQHRSMSMYDVEDRIYISRSTLTGDLRRVRQVLDIYGLELLRSSSRLIIDGTETDKRRCILGEKLFMLEENVGERGPIGHGGISSPAGSRDMDALRDILVRVLVGCRQQVSEVTLNNTLLQLFVMLRRMEDNFFLGEEDLPREARSLLSYDADGAAEAADREWRIARKVLQAAGRHFLLRIPEAETAWLALSLKGSANYTDESGIPEEINDLVLNGLRQIRASSGIDLTDDLNLRISLGLHLKASLIRIRYDMQLEDQLAGYIRQTYPQGFDIATYFAAWLQRRFGKKINDEEIALLAIHLYKALSDLQSKNGTRRILVISSLRRSENILLRQTIHEWFRDQIADLYFVFPEEMTPDFLDRYDTFFTTEKGAFYEQGLAVYISPFPGRQDYLNMKMALDGFSGPDDLTAIFPEELFFPLSGNDKDKALRLLCERSEQVMDLEGLYPAVLQRENMGSSFLANRTAAPHPHTPLSSSTFIAVGYSPAPILWDEEKNPVNVVLLIHMGKNNPHAFQIWNYLSRIIGDPAFTGALAEDPSYRHFMELMKASIARRE